MEFICIRKKTNDMSREKTKQKTSFDVTGIAKNC